MNNLNRNTQIDLTDSSTVTLNTNTNSIQSSFVSNYSGIKAPSIHLSSNLGSQASSYSTNCANLPPSATMNNISTASSAKQPPRSTSKPKVNAQPSAKDSGKLIK